MNDETERLVTTSFFLGLRVSQSINNLPPPDSIRYAALVETLEAIAAGDALTLEAAADLLRIRPELTDVDTLQRDYTSLQQLIGQTVLHKLRSPARPEPREE